MNWQRRNYRTRLREDSWWQTSDTPTSRRKLLQHVKSEPQDDVNDEEEVYNDVASISSVTMAGVKDKIHRFGGGAKPDKPPKPTVYSKISSNFLNSNEKDHQTTLAHPHKKPVHADTKSPKDINKPDLIVKQNGVNSTDKDCKKHGSGVDIDWKSKLNQVSLGYGPPPSMVIQSELFIKQRKMSLGESSADQVDEAMPSSGKRPISISRYKTIVVTKDGSTKFEKLPKSIFITTELKPTKPYKLKDNRVIHIIEEFKKAFSDFKDLNEELYDDIGNFMRPQEEYYDDCGNTVNRESDRISRIPDMPEEEEEELESAGSASGGSASGGSAPGCSGSAGSAGSTSGGSLQVAHKKQKVEEEFEETLEEVYDVLSDDIVSRNEPTSPKQSKEKEKEAAEKKKREDKERKDREKKELKKEKDEKAKADKERKDFEKKEKEERDIRKRFKITGSEMKEADGTVISKTKGSKFDLASQAGDHMEIIRMTDNPKGKFLVRNDAGTVGYVDSSNINIETPTIKQI